LAALARLQDHGAHGAVGLSERILEHDPEKLALGLWPDGSIDISVLTQRRHPATQLLPQFSGLMEQNPSQSPDFAYLSSSTL
jgi:hypothetical protein